jgi:hypothetical protein
MPKTQAQKDAQRKYQKKAPRAMVECKQRYRDKNVEKYLEYGRKSSNKQYYMTRNYKLIDTTMGGCIFKLFDY